MQTERRQQFRFNRQVWVIILICLVALALPLTGVLLTLQSLTRPRAAQEAKPAVSEPLRSMLEEIADKSLAPEKLVSREASVELIARELNVERARIEGLLATYGGAAIPRLESEGEVRLLVQLPAERLEDFLAACRDGRQGGLAGDLSSGLLEIVIRKSSPQ